MRHKTNRMLKEEEKQSKMKDVKTNHELMNLGDPSCDDSSVPCFEPTGVNAEASSQFEISDESKGHSAGSNNQGIVLVQRETRTLAKLRLGLYSFLFIIAISSSIGLYYFGASHENASFETSYQAHASKLVGSFEAKAKQIMEAMGSLSHLITISAITQGEEWPFVTIEDSGHFFDTYLSMMDATYMTVMPIIENDLRDKWEEYSIGKRGWLDKEKHTYAFFSQYDDTNTSSVSQWQQGSLQNNTDAKSINPIHSQSGIDTTTGPWVVLWQFAPAIDMPQLINYNYLAEYGFSKELASIQNIRATISHVTTSSSNSMSSGLQTESNIVNRFIEARNVSKYDIEEPLSYIRFPVADNFADHVKTQRAVAVLSAGLYWKTFLVNQMPQDIRGIFCVFQNSDNQSFTYRIDGSEASFVGYGDWHDPSYDALVESVTFSSFQQEKPSHGGYKGVPIDDDFMTYQLSFYPSDETKIPYTTNMPLLSAVVMLLVFLFTAVNFIFYNRYVERRQKNLMLTALKSSAVVASLFPSTVRDRLLAETDAYNANGTKNLRQGNIMNSIGTPKEAIADFFPEVTILFADISGFTAWCSQREPAKVFYLLESLFSIFDEHAKRLHIFKVETVGDCYVATCGLPEKRSDHALAMSRFARRCLSSLGPALESLETVLGPGTNKLNMRFGLHSGAVTAGIVRGKNARFQLFGDSVNTASRMESTGIAGRIQVSKKTADLLIEAGKDRWLQERKDAVIVKGKGEMTTYWLARSSVQRSTSTCSSGVDANDSPPLDGGRLERLVNWNVELLVRHLQKIASARKDRRPPNLQTTQSIMEIESKFGYTSEERFMDDAKEIIDFQSYGNEDTTLKQSATKIQAVTLDEIVIVQLRHYILSIAQTYRDNLFHNFDHASNVCLSVTKLLSRIDAPMKAESTSETQQDFLVGVSSDPLTQFACVFSAIIHDCDHAGVPNSQLIKENAPIAAVYNNKSVAERHSVDLAFVLLMSDSYRELRAAIYSTEAELLLFRQLVVNAVLATDIMDSELKSLRNERWEKAFFNSTHDDTNRVAVNRKATIVIEHLIQASDVAHTMQHWHIYRKWNECLFMECFEAYKSGRAEIDPAGYWYNGELGFFDNYIIPLAKKLKECGIFGVSSDECLDYALSNRREWEEKGKEIVNEMIEKANFNLT